MRNKLPEGWKEVELGELFDLKYGSSLKEEKRIDGQFKVYGSNGIVGFHNESTTLGKTIIVGRKGSVGKINLSEKSCFPIDTTYYIDETKKPCDLKWLYYVLKTLNLESLNRAAAVPGLNRKDVYSTKIPLPPFPTQKKIVSILEKAEQAKELRKTADELTKDFLKAVFMEMFGNPFKNRNNFIVKKVYEVVNLINGRAFKPSDWSNYGLKIIRIQNLNNPNAEYNYYNGEVKEQYIVEKGDLLLSWSGTPGTSFGVFVWNGERSVLNQHIFNVKLKDKTLNKLYFQYFINAKLMELISKAHGGVGLQHITKAELDNVDFSLPPIELQNKFASIVKEVESMKEQQKHSKEQIDKLFNALMQKAFRGELEK